MASEFTGYDPIDEAALLGGFGLVIVGSAVLGVFETLLGSVHVTKRISGVGVVIVHTSFSPHLRASIIAFGFLILFLWGLSRIGRAVLS